jgi:membrane-associated phospholipid phosphatase
MQKSTITLAIASIAIIAIFLIFPEIDLKVSAYFFDYTQNKFIHRDSVPSAIIYYSVRLIAFSMAIYFFLQFAEIFRRKYLPNLFPVFNEPNYSNCLGKIKSPALREMFKIHSARVCIYIVAIIIITPGLLVHNVMKPLWDRARPVNIVEFGGTKTFTPAFHFSDQGENSFPSGHAAMAFILVGLAFLQKNRQRFLQVYTVMFIYGVIASICRVWMGGHFLSDVAVGGMLSILTAHIGYYLIFGKEEYQKFFKK